MSEPEKRPVAIPPLWETPDVPTRVKHSAASWLGAHVLRPLWLWRRELVVVLAPGLVGCLPWVLRAPSVSRLHLEALGGGLVLAYLTLGLLLVVGPARVRLGRWLHTSRLRRRWDGACRFSQLETVSVRVPRIQTLVWVPAGARLTVRLPKGLSTDDVESGAERIAAAMDVRSVRVHRDPARARYPVVHVLDDDPFRDDSGPVRVPSALASARSWSLAEGVPVGLDELGDVVTLRLVGRNLLIGGEPEAGKSVALGNPLAAASLDRDAVIYGMDAKQVELSLWAPVMRDVVYTDIDDAIALLQHLISEMDHRYAVMQKEGIRSIPLTSEWPITILAVDELRFYTAHPDRKKRASFNELFIDFVARGRAAGFPSVAGTQKPSSDVVPTSLRDLFAYRWALRCTTKDASDTILGAGWASEGYSASEVDAADRGVGLLLAEGALPRWAKSSYLDDDDIRAIVKRGVDIRREVET